MSIDATRIEKVEVQINFPFEPIGVFTGALREKDAKTLMHSLAGALGYTCVPKESTR